MAQLEISPVGKITKSWLEGQINAFRTTAAMNEGAAQAFKKMLDDGMFVEEVAPDEKK